MSINRQEFTQSGRDMLGRANAGESLIISKVVIGAGRASEPEDLWPRTTLIDYKMDSVISQKIDQGFGVLLIDTAFNSSQAPEAFDLCEVGVMARIGTESERLYSVANVLATGADHVDPDVESIHAFKIKVVIDRATNVTVTIGDSTDIMAENIGADTVGPGWFSDKLANTLRFKRAIEGEGIELLETADTIRIGQRSLEIDLDLYVPVNHPQAPGPEVAFPTLDLALDHLMQYRIPANRRATVHVGPDKNIIVPRTIGFNHPDAVQVQIVGEPMETVTGNNLRSSGAGLFDISVPDTSIFSIGDVVCTRVLANGRWSGIRNITGLNANDLRLQTYFRAIDYTTPVPGNFQVNYWPTTFRCTQGFLHLPYGIGRLENFCVIGPGTTTYNGISILSGETALFNVGMFHFHAALYAVRARATISGSCVFGVSDTGIRGSEGATIAHIRPATTCIVNCCAQAGVLGENGAIFSLGAVVGPLDVDAMITGNTSGIIADSMSFIRISAVTLTLHTTAMAAQSGGYLEVGYNAGPINCLDNTLDVLAQRGGSAIGSRNGGGIGTFNPPNHSAGNQNGYIGIL